MRRYSIRDTVLVGLLFGSALGIAAEFLWRIDPPIAVSAQAVRE